MAECASLLRSFQPGIFAVGDVRSGSVKRVASVVGEGSVVIQAVHQFLNPGAAWVADAHGILSARRRRLAGIAR